MVELTQYAKDILAKKKKPPIAELTPYAKEILARKEEIKPVIEPELPIEPPIKPLVEPPVEPVDLLSALERLYPEAVELEQPEMIAQTIETFATEEPEAFLEDLVSKGRTPDTEALLTALGATPEDIEAMFAPLEPFEIPPEGYEFVEEIEEPVEPYIREVIEDGVIVRKLAETMPVRKLFTIRPDFSVWLEGESFGIYNPETGEITPNLAPPNKFLDAIETGLQYVEGWWKTGLMEAGFALYKGMELVTRKENRWTSEAETIMNSAYEKHGWKAIFSDEVNEAWDIYFLERQVRGPAKIVAELANPLWWTGAGGLAGLLTKPFTKIPVLGKPFQAVAKGVQVTEEVALLPLTAPLKGGIRFAGKAIGIKPTRPFLTDILPTASELKATLFKNDTFRKVAQHIPGMKWLAPGTVISEKLPATLTNFALAIPSLTPYIPLVVPSSLI